jgi:hypothetical protein
MKKSLIFKKILFIGFLSTNIFAMEQIEESIIEKCISENSGEAGVFCLESLYNKGKDLIKKKESNIRTLLQKKHESDDLGDVHYESAIKNLDESSKIFKSYSNKLCNFNAYSAGGVASGFNIVYFSCLIEQNNFRIKILNRALFYK